MPNVMPNTSNAMPDTPDIAHTHAPSIHHSALSYSPGTISQITYAV